LSRYLNQPCNEANDANGSACGEPHSITAVSKFGGGFFFACLPTRRAFESAGAMTARAVQCPKQGQRAARVGKEKAPRRTRSEKVRLFRNVGGNLNALIGQSEAQN